jgi:GDPmannose 4,6-dehydratase
MKKKLALITGVSGQDGSYLADFLLKKNYNVVGADRRSSRSDMWRLKRLEINNKIILEELELSETYEITRLLKKYKFDEIYNLAAQSFVKSSFNSPVSTSDINGLGVLRILEAIRELNPKTKFYQASSSEMFGKVLEKKQNEKTPFNPRSPYATAKLFGHFITKNYRESYGLYAVSGILFNHESPLR